jgi:hypothetical protein
MSLTADTGKLYVQNLVQTSNITVGQTITASNIGIGLTNPVSALDIAGAIYVRPATGLTFASQTIGQSNLAIDGNLDLVGSDSAYTRLASLGFDGTSVLTHSNAFHICNPLTTQYQFSVMTDGKIGVI